MGGIHAPGRLSRNCKGFLSGNSDWKSYEAVHRLRRAADGEYRWYHARGEPLRDREGRIVQWYGLSIDIDERKRAEQALRESEAKFRDYAETASDWFWEIGPDYKFTLLTENAFGSDPAVESARRAGITLSTLKRSRRSGGLSRQLSMHVSRSVTSYTAPMGRNGSPMYVRASGKPVFDTSGEFRGYRGTGTDVTAIMRAQQVEESLRTAQAELAHVGRVATLGQLTASIAHEVTQPIGSARNNARAALNFLDRQPPNLGEVKEALECVVADADRAGQLLAVFGITSRKRRPERSVLILMKRSMKCCYWRELQ